MTVSENGKLDKIILEIEELKKSMHAVQGIVTLHTDEVIAFNSFRNEFRKENGWVPKIIDGVRDSFRKDIRRLHDDIFAKFDMLPCFDLKFDNDGKLQSQCRIANESEPLKDDERAL